MVEAAKLEKPNLVQLRLVTRSALQAYCVANWHTLLARVELGRNLFRLFQVQVL
jgi:hypothetical protein